ncbi:hypothetical protein BS78_02G128200 [Paspalum vaginatum]|nr:hypothetical protein BS78_02G128200 [Paspalum vaginatum]
MAGRCADWNERTTKTFLDLCIDEKKSDFNNKKGLTKQGWQNLYRHFRQQTGRSYSSKQLQNKFNTLKRLFRVWKNLKNRSGPGWDEKTGTITCSDEWWEVRIEEDSRAEQFCNRGLQFEDELTTLFGSLDSDNGTMMCVGAIGDRTPSGESEEDLNPLTGDAAGRSEDNVGHSSVSRLAQRL